VTHQEEGEMSYHLHTGPRVERVDGLTEEQRAAAVPYAEEWIARLRRPLPIPLSADTLLSVALAAYYRDVCGLTLGVIGDAKLDYLEKLWLHPKETP
jgi:hypothetical protein